MLTTTYRKPIFKIYQESSASRSNCKVFSHCLFQSGIFRHRCRSYFLRASQMSMEICIKFAEVSTQTKKEILPQPGKWLFWEEHMECIWSLPHDDMWSENIPEILKSCFTLNITKFSNKILTPFSVLYSRKN